MKRSTKVSWDQSRVLRGIAFAYGKQGKWYQARKIINLITIEDVEAEALAELLTIWAENKNPALVKERFQGIKSRAE